MDLIEVVNKHNEVVIVDLSNVLYRYLWAFKDLSVMVDGELIKTGHFYGVTQLLINIKNNFNNPAIILCVDGYDKKRKELLESYKQGRNSNVDVDGSGKTTNVHKDTGFLFTMLSLMKDIYFVYDPDYEADDSIGTLVRRVVKEAPSKLVYMLTTDRDMYQMIGGNVKQVKKFGSGKNFLYDAQYVTDTDVFEEFGVYPKDLLLYRAMKGDSSDKITGYYRFPAKVATYIAENFSQDSFEKLNEVKVDKMPKDHTLCKAVEKGLITINNDINIFKRNLELMGLKETPMDIKTLNCDRPTAMNLCMTLRMNKFVEYINGQSK